MFRYSAVMAVSMVLRAVSATVVDAFGGGLAAEWAVWPGGMCCFVLSKGPFRIAVCALWWGEMGRMVRVNPSTGDADVARPACNDKQISVLSVSNENRVFTAGIVRIGKYAILTRLVVINFHAFCHASLPPLQAMPALSVRRRQPSSRATAARRLSASSSLCAQAV